jgi:hypothetical protein
LLYYAPAFLANLNREMQKIDKENWLKNTIKIWLTTLARLYQKAETHYANHPDKQWTIICNISDIANAMSDSSCISKLKDLDIEINKKWDWVKASLKDKRIHTDEMSYFHNIDNIPWDDFLIVAMWWGSDSVQATEVANLLKQSGKKVNGIISIRTNKTGSQVWNDKIWEERRLQNVEEIADWVYQINQDSSSTSWRFYENISVQEWHKTYVITYNPDTEDAKEISEKLNLIQKTLWGKTILWIDTWGDVLYKFSNKEAEHGHSKDQDISVLNAIKMLEWVEDKHLFVLAPGIDTPDDVNDIIKKQWWVMYIPNSNESESITDFYERNWFDGSDPKKYWKTSNAFYLANKDRDISWWEAMLSIPKENIVDSNNIWDPYVNIQDYTKWWILVSL